MTEADKTRDRGLKAAVSESLPRQLSAASEKVNSVLDTDPRLRSYVAGVASDPQGHNLYEQLAVGRFLALSEQYGWRADRVLRFFKFYEALKFSGTQGRRNYVLTPVQTFIFASIFGFADAQGRRLFRTVYLFVPRKFAKTTSVAALAIYDMLFGDVNAQAYVAANSYAQAKICFNEIRAIMRGIDPGERHLRINRELVNFRDAGRDSLIRCLSGNAKTQDGLNASLVIMDEYAQARDTAGQSGAELKNVLTSSMGARREPLTVITTTASDVLDGPFAHELEGVRRVLRGEAQSDRVFAMLFQPDVDDEEGDEATWCKVQPHLGITIQPDYYEMAWADAQLSAENMLTFRTKLLNVFAVNEKDSWITAELAARCSRPFSLSDFGGRPAAMCSIDLSESGDFSAVSVGIYADKTHTFYFKTSYFFPEGALKGHCNEALYRLWASQGHIILTDGDVIDYRAIVDHILALNREVTILQIGYDPWKSAEVVNMLSAAGAKNALVPVRQTYGYFTAPTESFEHGMKTGHIVIDDNPINAYCFGNAVLDEDRLENKKPIKRSGRQKIDGVITMLMCMRLFIDFKQ